MKGVLPLTMARGAHDGAWSSRWLRRDAMERGQSDVGRGPAERGKSKGLVAMTRRIVTENDFPLVNLEGAAPAACGLVGGAGAAGLGSRGG